MNTHDDQATAAAKRFYGVHQGEHLQHDAERLIDRCAVHIGDLFYLPKTQARDVARQAKAAFDDAPPVAG